jgi:transposase
VREHGVQVLEINRPDRSRRRLRGKNDPTDAESAARAVLAGEANAIPKAQSGAVEAMRAVSMARRSAVKAKTQAINQLKALLVTARRATILIGYAAKPRWGRSAVQARGNHPRERRRDIGSTGAAIGPPIMPCGRFRWFECGVIVGHVRT